MLRIRWFVLCLTITMLVSGISIRSSGSAAQETEECAGMEAYVQSFDDIGSRLEEQNPRLDIDELETWTSQDFTAASAILDQIQIELSAVDVPPIAASYHETLVKVLGALGQMFDAMNVAGIFGGLAYVDIIEELTGELADYSLEIEVACDVALYDHDDDGVEEIGLGGTATDESQGSSSTNDLTASGSREDPQPIGTTVAVDESWDVTVLGVLPDATELVLQESEWNDPPASGRQFFIARVSVLYVGSESATFDARFRLSTVGAESVSYTMFDDDCGTIPDELPNPEVFNGGKLEGNICWSIRSEDADSLVMYDDNVDRDERAFLSLIPTEPGHLLEAVPQEVVAASSPASSPVRRPQVSSTPAVSPSSPQASSVASPAASPAASPGAADAVTVVSEDIFFDPDEVTIAADTDVTFIVPNDGAAPHNFSIDELEIDIDQAPGESHEVVINAPAGEYEFYCNVPGHREAGMVGTLIVE